MLFKIVPNYLIRTLKCFIMNRISVSYNYKYRLDFAPNYVFTTCKKCINIKRAKEVKKVYNNGCLQI
jgi:hypothetical protein